MKLSEWVLIPGQIYREMYVHIGRWGDEKLLFFLSEAIPVSLELIEAFCPIKTFTSSDARLTAHSHIYQRCGKFVTFLEQNEKENTSILIYSLQ